MELINNFTSNAASLNLTKLTSAILLDDGHGWITAGKRSNDGSLRENEFNSSITARLSLLASLYGINSKQIAPLHTDVSLENRVNNEREQLRSYKEKGITSTAGVSIHADWFHDESANGITVFYYNGSVKGKLLATEVLSSIAHISLTTGLEINIRGIKESKFYILRKTKSPFILIECGFMSNAKDLKFLKSDVYRDRLSVAIFLGIINYFNAMSYV